MLFHMPRCLGTGVSLARYKRQETREALVFFSLSRRASALAFSCSVDMRSAAVACLFLSISFSIACFSLAELEAYTLIGDGVGFFDVDAAADADAGGYIIAVQFMDHPAPRQQRPLPSLSENDHGILSLLAVVSKLFVFGYPIVKALWVLCVPSYSGFAFFAFAICVTLSLHSDRVYWAHYFYVTSILSSVDSLSAWPQFRNSSLVRGSVLLAVAIGIHSLQYKKYLWYAPTVVLLHLLVLIASIWMIVRDPGPEQRSILIGHTAL